MGIIGAILGDIAGSKWEFAPMSEKRQDGTYELFNEHNYFTDDTVLSIACKDAILKKKLFHKPDFVKAYDYWGNKYKDRGYGSSFLCWLDNDNKEPYNSYGNGSAMRCSYIGQYTTSLKQCDELAKLSAICTHNHPEGIKGAVVLAHCVWMAEHNDSKDNILNYAIKQYMPVLSLEPYNINFPKDGMINDRYIFSPANPTKFYKDEITYKISCQGSVPVAIRCFYETNSFEECMFLINSMCIDTDTVGAIAGAICESYYKKCMDNDEELLKRYLPEEMFQIIYS